MGGTFLKPKNGMGDTVLCIYINRPQYVYYLLIWLRDNEFHFKYYFNSYDIINDAQIKIVIG